MKKLRILTNGIVKENPIFFQLLGMCPTLAVTTSAENGMAMGLATTAVVVCSNAIISMMRKIIPAKIRIPIFIVVIATLVTVVGMIMEGFVNSLYQQLGIFIPLIVVNCLILARAEAYAFKNTVVDSVLDGVGMGTGFTLALILLGAVRELIGAGTIFGTQLMWASYKPALIMILPPGAFLALGLLLALNNTIKAKKVA
ncbi:MAG: electron transport complex subunit E [Acidaminobacteraceae bacterium]